MTSNQLLCFSFKIKFNILECKQAEDRAIALINACGDEDTLVIGSFRSMLNDEEDNEDYDDYDYPGEWDWLHDYDM